MTRGTSRKNLAKYFCHCIKKVRKTVKVRDKTQSFKAREQAAIAICTKSVLQTRGRTLRKFKCGKRPFLETQTRKK